MDDIDKAIAEKLKLFTAQFGAYADGTGLEPSPLPPELFHYTNLNGMKGIIENQCIWATHFEYLNDFTEIVHGETLAKDLILERLALCSTLTKDILTHVLSDFDYFTPGSDIYIACFCEKKDLLSQWRSYGAGGCAIGLVPPTISKDGKEMLPSIHSLGFVVAKVIYDENEQKRMMSKIVNECFAFIEQFMPGILPFLEDQEEASAYLKRTSSVFLKATLYILFSLACRFKKRLFESEQEWRFIFFVQKRGLSFEEEVRPYVTDISDVPKTKFRIGKDSLIPYVEFPLHTDRPHTPVFKFSQVVCGPSMHPGSLSRSVSMLLAHSGLHDIKVTGSDIPLRV
jgi:hypothetical protein